MRKSMLRDLYYGNILPWERKRVQDADYNLLIRKIEEIEVQFRNLLSPEYYEKLEEMKNLQAQAEAIEEAYLFEYAFCMGALMMCDIFDYRENI